jgi:trigger factor
MDTTTHIETLSSVLHRVSVEIPQAEVDQRFGSVLNKMVKKVQLPGFRKGKAPVGLVVKAYGMEAIGAEVANDLINDSIKLLLEKREINPLYPPQLDDVKELPVKGKGFSFSFSIEVAPQVEVGDYTGHVLEIEEVDESDATVNQRLGELCQEFPETESVTEMQPYSSEDSQNKITYSVRYAQNAFGTDGSRIDELSVEDMYLRVNDKEIVNSLSFKAILEHFKTKGCKVGEQISFTSLPVSNEAASEVFKEKLAEDGTVAKVEVNITDIEKATPAALNDELAQKVKLESLEALKERILENVKVDNKNTRATTLRQKIVEKVLEKFPLEVPPSMLNNALEDHLKRLEQQYRFAFPRDSEFAQLQAQQILFEIQSQLIMAKIGEKEELSWSKEAHKEFLIEFNPHLGPEQIEALVLNAEEEMKSQDVYAFKTYQVLEFLIKNNKIKAIPPVKKE